MVNCNVSQGKVLKFLLCWSKCYLKQERMMGVCGTPCEQPYTAIRKQQNALILPAIFISQTSLQGFYVSSGSWSLFLFSLLFQHSEFPHLCKTSGVLLVFRCFSGMASRFVLLLVWGSSLKWGRLSSSGCHSLWTKINLSLSTTLIKKLKWKN